MPKYIVRYGSMRALGVHSTRGGDRFHRGDRVVARTNRGLEIGEVLSEATEDSVSHLKDPPTGQILRCVTLDDENELSHIESKLAEEFETCIEFVRKLNLQMDLVDIEHLFGGERMVIYYLAEQRVDFRELVKQLASEFQTRIEMRQIGVRDEAKLLADYGDCGKPLCCNTHLNAMPPVSMKMAKLQKATLDPTKISGRCGRLKCCLRYEYDTYEALYKELPPIGSEILTNNGRARVLGQEILAEQLLVEGEDNRRMVIHASEVLTVVKRGSGKRSKPKSQQAEGGTSTQSQGESNRKESGPSNRRGSRKDTPSKQDDSASPEPSNKAEADAGEPKEGNRKDGKPRGKRRSGRRNKNQNPPAKPTQKNGGDSDAVQNQPVEDSALPDTPNDAPAATDGDNSTSTSEGETKKDAKSDSGRSGRRRRSSRKPKRRDSQ